MGSRFSSADQRKSSPSQQQTSGTKEDEAGTIKKNKGVHKKSRKKSVPKALLKQKKQFLNTMKKEQNRSAKATMKINEERLHEERKESGILKKVSKNRLLNMVSVSWRFNTLFVQKILEMARIRKDEPARDRTASKGRSSIEP